MVQPSISGGRLAARFEIDGAEANVVESLQASLFVLGAAGTWERDGSAAGLPLIGGEAAVARLDAYFFDEQWDPELCKKCASLGSASNCPFEGFELIIDQDWMAAHRALAQPLSVGRLLIDPREPDDLLGMEQAVADVGGSKILIKVPARRAFGTGSHETTRLVLRQMQSEEFAGQRVLDVGCGTGVLSFAAHALGAREAIGYDVDPVAAVLAVENRALNALPDSIQFFAGTEAALDSAVCFDFALVNVLPEKIKGSEEDIARLVGHGGAILVSGLLDGEPSTAAALSRWRRGGWREVARTRENEWILVRLERGSDQSEARE